MTAPRLQRLPHRRDGIYRRADALREHAEQLHRDAQTRREQRISRCPSCGGWLMHPQPGEGGRNRLPGRARPAAHHCPTDERTNR